jgi:hypothetical protein
METTPPELGHAPLILMSNTPASLAMVQLVSRQVADPAQIEITLAHYLEPLSWQTLDAGQAHHLDTLFKEEEGLLAENGTTTIAPESSYFEKANGVFIRAGVPADHVHIETGWQRSDVIAIRLDQLNSGRYSTVVIVRHHYDILYRFLGQSLRQILAQFGHQIHVWVFDA